MHKKINKVKLTIILLISSLCGCQALMYGTGSDLNKISVGMSTTQVIATLGEPQSYGSDLNDETEKFYYRKMNRVLEWSPTSYVVVFKNGKVVKYGEVGN